MVPIIEDMVDTPEEKPERQNEHEFTSHETINGGDVKSNIINRSGAIG